MAVYKTFYGMARQHRTFTKLTPLKRLTALRPSVAISDADRVRKLKCDRE